MPDCEEPVLIHEAVDTVDLILPVCPVPRFSKSPVLRCLRIFKPWKGQGTRFTERFSRNVIRDSPTTVPSLSFLLNYCGVLEPRRSAPSARTRPWRRRCDGYACPQDRRRSCHRPSCRCCAARSSTLESFWGESGTPYQTEPTAGRRNHVFFRTATGLDMCLKRKRGGYIAIQPQREPHQRHGVRRNIDIPLPLRSLTRILGSLSGGRQSCRATGNSHILRRSFDL